MIEWKSKKQIEITTLEIKKIASNKIIIDLKTNMGERRRTRRKEWVKKTS